MILMQYIRHRWHTIDTIGRVHVVKCALCGRQKIRIDR